MSKQEIRFGLQKCKIESFCFCFCFVLFFCFAHIPQFSNHKDVYARTIKRLPTMIQALGSWEISLFDTNTFISSCFQQVKGRNDAFILLLCTYNFAVSAIQVSITCKMN